MFLPVLLVHDFGFAGWLVFAIPNVIGAAAMAWLLRDGEQSRKIVQQHRIACTVFSIVTILFHLYFLAWVVMRIANPLIAILAIPLAALIWMLARSDRASVRTAMAIYVLSLLAFFCIIAFLGIPTSNRQQLPLAFGQHGVAWLLPVCCLGFFTCPYLDLTFHRARQTNGRDGARLAFGLGFCVFFLLMILFTLCYAGPIYKHVFSGGVNDLAIWLVAGHMTIQSAFTIAAHAREICPVESIHPTRIFVYGGFALIFFGVFAGLLIFSPEYGVDGYLFFMAFYALVVPAYLCCQMITRRPVGLFFSIPMILAMPFYYLGFFQNQTIYLLPGVAIVLIAACLARYSGSRAASANSASLPARHESTL